MAPKADGLEIASEQDYMSRKEPMAKPHRGLWARILVTIRGIRRIVKQTPEQRLIALLSLELDDTRASPYFVNFDPIPTKLRMFFGRRQEIRAIADYLRNGDSILLIGERRMGKTFLLRMLEDLPRRGAEFYKNLLDRHTGALLAELRVSTASYRWAFVDMLVVTNVAGFYFKVLAELAEEQVEQWLSLSPIDHTIFASQLARLSEDLYRKGQRAFVLVDESEKLLTLNESAEVLSCLKAVIQQCESIDFLLAGDIKSHQTTPEFANLKGTLRTIHLAPLHPDDVKALIQVPVTGHLSFEDSVLQRILDLTDGKPSLVQIVCGHLYQLATEEREDISEIHITLTAFDCLWESELREKVFESFDAPLRDFFEGLNGHERSIFSFLAHKPLATADDISKALGIHSSLVQRGLYRLRSAHRIRETESGFRIGAKIVEEFGSRFVPCPSGEVSQPASAPQALADMLTGENTNVEYKSSMRWDLHRQQVNKALEKVIAKTVAGFLNSEGGTLLIGVADDCTVLGIEHDLKTISRKDRDGYERALRQVLTNAMGVEFSQYQHVFFEEIEGKTVCIVRVEPSPKPVYLTDKGAAEFYVRIGPATQPLDMQTAHDYIKMHWST